jgi:small subunit ribosomal protein S1
MPVSGRVSAVNAGGLTVEIGGVRGFCPVSQIDTTFVTDPSVFVGRTLEFIVTRVEDARGGVVLSRRQQLMREQGTPAARRAQARRRRWRGAIGSLGAFVDLGGRCTESRLEIVAMAFVQ